MLKRLSLLLFLASVCAPAQARVDQVAYMKNGVYSGKIGTYSLGGEPYLDAGQTAKLVGGKIYWYPVSGKLLMQIKGKRVLFSMKSDTIRINDEDVSFPDPLIVRGGRAFLALKFFVSDHFSEAFGFSLNYDKSSRVLSAKHAVNVTSVNYFSYPDKTRIVVYMEEPLQWQATQKENNLFRVNIFRGIIDHEEKLAIGDGVVRSVDLLQDNKAARLIVDPGDNFGEAKVFSLSGPERLVIDVSKKASTVRQTISGDPGAFVTPSAGAAPASGADPSSSSAAGQPAPQADSRNVAVILPSSAAPVPGGAQPAASDAAALNIPDKLQVGGAGRKRIVIDAGHGGKDAGGNRLFGMREKELNLAVAKDLYKLLKKDSEFEVMMTRDDDTFVPLSDRSNMANNFKADLFISLHANASRDRREKGFEVYFMSEKASDPGAAEVADYENSVVGLEDNGGQSENDAAAMLLHSMARNEYLNEGSRLAGLVSKEMEKHTPFVDRGVKQAAFYVLRGTYAPGILVEMGFMTNSHDQRDLNKKKVRAEIANSIYRGIVDYAKMKKWK